MEGETSKNQQGFYALFIIIFFRVRLADKRNCDGRDTIVDEVSIGSRCGGHVEGDQQNEHHESI